MSSYDLLKFSYQQSYGWVIDGEIIDAPYYDFLLNAKHIPFLGGICDGDALNYIPDWITTPGAGNLTVFNDYVETFTVDRGLAQV